MPGPQELVDDAGRCQACAWRCDLRDGSARCGVRALGPAGLVVDEAETHAALQPIERKPLYHLRPGGKLLTLGSYGCSFRCPYCRNADVALAARRPGGRAPTVDAAQLVEAARRLGAVGLAYSYNEPLVRAERVAAVLGAARTDGLEAVMVTHGCATDAAVALLGPRTTAWRIDVKAARAVTGELLGGPQTPWAAAFQTIRRLRRDHGVHVEVSVTYAPEIHDDDELRRLGHALARAHGGESVAHVQPLLPAHRLRRLAPPDPARLLGAAQALREGGTRWVYVHGLPGRTHSETRCRGCGEVLTRRGVGRVEVDARHDSSCPRCETVSPLVMAPPRDRGLA